MANKDKKQGNESAEKQTPKPAVKEKEVLERRLVHPNRVPEREAQGFKKTGDKKGESFFMSRVKKVAETVVDAIKD